ncbi:hypothetical protein PRZ48_014653 [Zasmidium cellare]|uniref:Uncharacterized protein n=1 Tax=Zasmidium cellare TaxID=395010 RepID=A0ABR0DYV7_ZASCE|nr:hypothetical protein PRZ48_014653 [Zasmidium cellare]
MSSPSPKQNNIKLEREDDVGSPAAKRKDPQEDGSNLTTPVKRSKSIQRSVETDTPVSEVPDLNRNDTSPTAQQALPSTPARQFQHFFSMKEAVEGEQRRPVASADDDIQEVKRNEKEWAAKILDALYATDRNHSMLDKVSDEKWKKMWPSFDEQLPQLLKNAKDVEQKAWLVLHEVLDLQEHGLRLKMIRPTPSNFKRFDASQVLTMKTSARLDQLLQYLSTCSCLACCVIKESQVHEIVAHPAGVLATKSKYKDSNVARGQATKEDQRRKSSVASQGRQTNTEQQRQQEVTQADRGERLSALDTDAFASPDRAQRAVTMPPQHLFNPYRSYLDSYLSARPQFTSSASPSVENQTIGANLQMAGLQQPSTSSRAPPNPYAAGPQAGTTNSPTAAFQQPFSSSAMPPNPYAVALQGGLPSFGLDQQVASYGTRAQTPAHNGLPTYYQPQQQHVQYQGAEVQGAGIGGGTSENPIELDDGEEDVVKKVESED